MKNKIINKIDTNNKLFTILIFIIFFIPRIIGLGFDTWNVDAMRWNIRSDKFINAVVNGDFINTYQRYHPGVTLMWLSGLSKKLFFTLFKFIYGYNIQVDEGYVYPEKFFISVFFAKLPLIITISLTLTISIYLLKKLKISTWYLLLFAILLSIEPYFLGITRFYHLTGLETGFTFLAIITTYYAMHTNKNKYLLLSGLVLGLGMLTKISAIVALPFMEIIIFIPFIKNRTKENFITFVLNTLYILSTSISTFIVLFPSMWVEPINTLKKIYSLGLEHTGFYDGKHRSIIDNKFTYYYEIFITKTTALTIISLLGSFYFIRKEKSKITKSILVVAILYIIYYITIMSFPSKEMMRYILVVYPFAILLSSYFIYNIFKISSKTVKIFLTIFIFIYFTAWAWILYPDFSTIHSDLLGGYTGYSHINKLYNDGEHYLQIARYMNNTYKDKAYDYAIVVTADNRDVSVQQGFLGNAAYKDSLIKKDYAKLFYTVEYNDLNLLPDNCKYIKGFGHRWPDKFNFVYLYECPISSYHFSDED